MARSFLRQWTKDALPGDPSEMPDVRYGRLPLPEFPKTFTGIRKQRLELPGWNFLERSENEGERRGKRVGWEVGLGSGLALGSGLGLGLGLGLGWGWAVSHCTVKNAYLHMTEVEKR